MFGKLYAELKTTRVFLAALALFELGSLICAVAPNSITLIVGRAVSGIGCAGLFSGALIILATSVPLHRRPMYTGFIGGFSSIAQIIAPTLGGKTYSYSLLQQLLRTIVNMFQGVFTDRATWRWW
jgi:MFS family permease